MIYHGAKLKQTSKNTIDNGDEHSEHIQRIFHNFDFYVVGFRNKIKCSFFRALKDGLRNRIAGNRERKGSLSG